MAAGLDAPLTVARLPKRSDTLPKRYGAVAQLVERDNRTVEARGSIPLSSTTKGSTDHESMAVVGSVRSRLIRWDGW